MLNEKLFNESEAITVINSIIAISFEANTFHHYFNIVDGLLNLISDEQKVKICNEKNILNELINKYLLQNEIDSCKFYFQQSFDFHSMEV